jgi:hypothetical protein
MGLQFCLSDTQKEKSETVPLPSRETYRVVRCLGSHIVYTIGSQMAVKLSALRTGRSLLPRNILLLFLAVISVRD